MDFLTALIAFTAGAFIVVLIYERAYKAEKSAAQQMKEARKGESMSAMERVAEDLARTGKRL
jgi:hypothetical protein